MDDLKWIIGLFLLFGLLWFAGGGPARGPGNGLFSVSRPVSITEENHIPNVNGKKATKEEISAEIERVRKEIKTVEKAIKRLEEEKNASPYKEQVKISVGRARSSDARGEYLLLKSEAGSFSPVRITGWKLKSPITGRSAVIGKAANLPFVGRINVEQPIILPPGSTAIIATGRSPNGTSFRLNICSGFFGQFQDFSPSLPRQCPHPAKGELPQSNRPEARVYGASLLSDQCLDFIEGLPACEVVVNIPRRFLTESECQEFIVEKFSYDGCVADHRQDDGFFENEWRIYLDKEEELWKEKREVIELRDGNNKLVDVITY